MAFLRGAAERPHHAYVFAGPEEREIARRARLRRRAALSRRGVRRVSRLPPRRRGSSSERVPGGAGGPGHPRGHDPHRGLAAGGSHRARARAEGLPPPRGRPPVAAGGRHAAEGPRGAAGRRRPRAALRPARELPDTVLSRCHVVTFTALPEAFVVDELVRSGADEFGRGWRLASPGEPRPCSEARRIRGRHAVPRRRAVGDRACCRRPRRSARSRRRGAPGGGRYSKG